VVARWAGLKILIPEEGRAFDRASILPREVHISRMPPPGPPINRFTGRVARITAGEGNAEIVIEIGGQELRAEMTPDQYDALNLIPGDTVHGILRLRSIRGMETGQDMPQSESGA
jgi:molybdopterin-binding protein